MMRNVWLGVGFGLMLAVTGCGGTSIAPATMPVPPVRSASAGALIAPLSFAGLTINEAIATCSEIVHDRRPVGFHLIGKDLGGITVTASYDGTDPISPGTSDVEVPDDAMIQRLHPVRGTYTVQVIEPGRNPAARGLSVAERTALLAAVNRALTARPVGQNYQEQTRRIVLAFAKRTLEDPRSAS